MVSDFHVNIDVFQLFTMPFKGDTVSEADGSISQRSKEESWVEDLSFLDPNATTTSMCI